MKNLHHSDTQAFGNIRRNYETKWLTHKVVKFIMLIDKFMKILTVMFPFTKNMHDYCDYNCALWNKKT